MRIRFLALLVSLILVIACQSGAPASAGLFGEIWTDRGEGGVYEGGEVLTLFFRASEDAYVTIFNVNPAGTVRMVFPNQWDSDNLVKRGHLYAIPAAGAYRFVTGPPFGTEQVFALVTLAPLGEEVTDDAWSGLSLPHDGEAFANRLKAAVADRPEAEWSLTNTFFHVKPGAGGSV